jgi:LacI family transcriptional regulator
MADVARYLGVSKATVSNALTKNRHVSAATIERVEEACRKLGYQTNVIARSLRTSRTNLVGVTVPNINEPYQGLLVRYVEEYLRRSGYEILLGSYHFDVAEELRLLRTFQTLMVTGIIAISGLDDNTAHYEELADRIPTVFLSRDSLGLKISSVGQDAAQTAKNVIAYLAGRGHTRIAHFNIPNDNFRSLKLEAEGYAAACRERNLDDDPELLIADPATRLHEIHSSIDAAERIIATRATAVYAVSDYVGIGIVKGLTNAGVRVPKDVSVIGVGNVDYCLLTTPTLTTIDLEAEAVAHQGVRLLGRLQSGRRSSTESLVVGGSRIVERESVLDRR